MSRIRRRRLAVLMLMCGLAGCASTPLPAGFSRDGDPVELTETPFFPQLDHQCGPAALATVLAASGVAITAEQLTARVYLPGRQGSLQTELIAATRAYDRVAVVLDGGPTQIISALRGGSPVLVLLDLGRWQPVWHYAVVVGYEPGSSRFLLRSGRDRRVAMPLDRFMRAWTQGGQWALMVATLDTIPTAASPQPWIAAVAPLESLQQWSAAERGYRAATQRWPDSALSWTALGNVQARQQRWSEAVADYGRALQLEDGVAVRNNRAEAFGALGCATRARAELGRADALDVEHRHREVLAQTLADLPTVDACALDIN